MTIGTMTSKGQITVPADVREALGLGPGSRVDFVRRTDGVVELHVAGGSIRSLKGIVPALHQPVSLDDMDAAIAEGALDSGLTR